MKLQVEEINSGNELWKKPTVARKATDQDNLNNTPAITQIKTSRIKSGIDLTLNKKLKSRKDGHRKLSSNKNIGLWVPNIPQFNTKCISLGS